MKNWHDVLLVVIAALGVPALLAFVFMRMLGQAPEELEEVDVIEEVVLPVPEEKHMNYIVLMDEEQYPDFWEMEWQDLPDNLWEHHKEVFEQYDPLARMEDNPESVLELFGGYVDEVDLEQTLEVVNEHETKFGAIGERLSYALYLYDEYSCASVFEGISSMDEIRAEREVDYPYQSSYFEQGALMDYWNEITVYPFWYDEELERIYGYCEASGQNPGGGFGESLNVVMQFEDGQKIGQLAFESESGPGDIKILNVREDLFNEEGENYGIREWGVQGHSNQLQFSQLLYYYFSGTWEQYEDLGHFYY